MGFIFLNYRRADSEMMVTNLYSRLVGRYGDLAIFRDVNSIPFGVNFVYAIETYIQFSTVMLAVIGPNWLSVTDGSGKQRLNDPRDMVRQEIEIALGKRVRIIPILLDNTTMPDPLQLPESIREIVLLNAARIRSGEEFNGDIDRLFFKLELIIKDSTVPSGQAHAVGFIEEFTARDESYNYYPHMVPYARVRFLNPFTNQQDSALILRSSHWKIGDMIRIHRVYRFEPFGWRIFKEYLHQEDWEED